MLTILDQSMIAAQDYRRIMVTSLEPDGTLETTGLNSWRAANEWACVVKATGAHKVFCYLEGNEPEDLRDLRRGN